jgi:hypothetical protein
MQYARSEVRGQKCIRIGFITPRGEAIVLESHTEGKASVEHGRLVDPLGHSGSISLPVMYPERSTLCGPRSHISIEGRSAGAAPGESPRLFEGLQGFHSENFRIGVFRAGSEQLRVRQAPGSLRPGEKWVYSSGAGTSCYEIVDTRGHILWVEGANERITAELTRGALVLRQVSILSSSRERSHSDFSLRFEPGLPISVTADGNQARSESDFSISIDDQTSLVTGRATSQRGGSGINLMLCPDRPRWATDKKVATVVRKVGETLLLGTEVVP